MASFPTRFVLLIAGLLPALVGCASTTTIGPSTDPSVWATVNALEARSLDTDVHLRNGNYSLRVRQLQVGPDSTFWTTREGLAYWSTTDAVARVTFRTRSGVDFLRGAGIGLAVGVLFGGTAGLASGPGTGVFSNITRAESAMLGALVVSFVTVPVGAMIAGANGRRRIVRIAL